MGDHTWSPKLHSAEKDVQMTDNTIHLITCCMLTQSTAVADGIGRKSNY